jgi:hypothetical protein
MYKIIFTLYKSSFKILNFTLHHGTKDINMNTTIIKVPTEQQIYTWNSEMIHRHILHSKA